MSFTGDNTLGTEVTIGTIEKVYVQAGVLTFNGVNNSFTSFNVFGGTANIASMGTNNGASSIGKGSAYVRGGTTLNYTGNTASSDKGFTRDTTSSDNKINVTTAGQTLSMSGNLTSTGVSAGWTFGGAGNLTLSGVINNATSTTVTKNDAGTLTLSGTNTYTGGTTVNGGTLAVNGSTHVSSAVTVNSGSTLGGIGVVNGTVAVNANGALCPGTTAGDTQTLTISSTLTFASSGSTCQVDVAASASDLVLATGNVGLNNATLTLHGTLAAASYVILRTSGTLSGTFNGLANNTQIPSTSYYIHYVTSSSPNYIVLNQSPTPVVLLQLQALTVGGKVTVRWSTSSESKTAGFDLYRVVNGQSVKASARATASPIPARSRARPTPINSSSARPMARVLTTDLTTGR
ncbi:MAG: autotransporter-associated beta strand repeat-containing protein [Kiritimatiellaeota bacterium]|nr:autotransporter-associated beta strand repeat-containing protein [Kiritimatiellota bacterium]